MLCLVLRSILYEICVNLIKFLSEGREVRNKHLLVHLGFQSVSLRVSRGLVGRNRHARWHLNGCFVRALLAFCFFINTGSSIILSWVLSFKCIYVCLFGSNILPLSGLNPGAPQNSPLVQIAGWSNRVLYWTGLLLINMVSHEIKIVLLEGSLKWRNFRIVVY